MYTVAEILFQHARSAACQKVAIVDGPHRVTYADLLTRTLEYAALLKGAGLTKGDRVGIFLCRSVEAVAAFFGVCFAGGVAVVINEQLRARQVRYILDHGDASYLITDGRQLLYTGEPIADGTQVIDIDRITLPTALASPEPTIGADLALIIYTSGSTGFPKGVMMSHQNVLAGSQIVSDYLRLSENDAIISLLPFSFDYGLNQLLTALLAGGTLVIQRSLFPPDICRTLQREHVTGMAGVPTLWLQLTQAHSPFLKMTFPDLRYITNSGGRLPESTVKLIRRGHPSVDVYLMYGLTEAFRSTYLPPQEVDRRPSSIGKAVPNAEILVIDDHGQPCQVGETGELVHRGATVGMGYWRDPEESARVFRPHPFEQSPTFSPERVVYSGDLVKRDAAGYLYYIGRREQLIKSRGFRVSPDEIEAPIFASGDVAQVVAFAVPRNEIEDEIVAAVVPRDPTDFREERLRQYCKQEMPAYMLPRVIWRLDEIPLTTSGKPDRGGIKAAYLERHQSPAVVTRATRTA